MELDPKDYDVVKLLTKLKYNNEIYPKELLTPRRQVYIRRVAEIGLGVGVSSGLKTTVRSGSRSGGLSTTAGGLIEMVLILAIVVEAGAAAIIYRDEISALIQSRLAQPKVEEGTPVPDTVIAPDLPEAILTEPPDVTTTPLASETATGTIIASAAANQTSGNGSNNAGIQSNSTPDPNGNNGNQYGLTPKPDRTREPGGGGDNNNNNNKGKDK